jgi:hypothetical protein
MYVNGTVLLKEPNEIKSIFHAIPGTSPRYGGLGIPVRTHAREYAGLRLMFCDDSIFIPREDKGKNSFRKYFDRNTRPGLFFILNFLRPTLLPLQNPEMRVGKRTLRSRYQMGDSGFFNKNPGCEGCVERILSGQTMVFSF